MVHFQSKNQALIEVDNLEMAKQIVTHYTMNPPAIRQRTVYVQYSNHKELKTESNPGQEVKTPTHAPASEKYFCRKLWKN